MITLAPGGRATKFSIHGAWARINSTCQREHA